MSYYDDPFRSSREADGKRHSDTMEVLKAFVVSGNAGTLELDMDRYGHVKCKIALTGQRAISQPTITERKQPEGGLAVRALSQ